MSEYNAVTMVYTPEGEPEVKDGLILDFPKFKPAYMREPELRSAGHVCRWSKALDRVAAGGCLLVTGATPAKQALAMLGIAEELLAAHDLPLSRLFIDVMLWGEDSVKFKALLENRYPVGGARPVINYWLGQMTMAVGAVSRIDKVYSEYLVQLIAKKLGLSMVYPKGHG